MKHWSPDEDLIIRTFWPQGGYSSVKDFLPDRTRDAIRVRASALGLVMRAETKREIIRKSVEKRAMSKQKIERAPTVENKFLSMKW